MEKLTIETFDNLCLKDKGQKKNTINVGMSSCGIAAGADDIFSTLKEEIAEKDYQVNLTKVGCLGMCSAEPLVEVFDEEGKSSLYKNVDEMTAKRIIKNHFIKGKNVESHLLEKESIQTRIVLKNCGAIDPDSIDEYIAADGYQALKKVISSMTPSGVVDEMKTSGLRGRGGAGFPTWLKWSFAQKAEGDQKYFICNADEGDPGAYMDRSVLEGDPHAVIEGMIIGAIAIGATKGFIYIRAEYPLAIERIQHAIDQANKYGFLGKNILGSDYEFDLEIRLGAGAFVCGEETALIASIEGKRGTPIPRPPFPATSGLWKKPTNINNVETLANIPPIIRNGGEWFSGYGTEQSKGTKVFALTGKIKNCGLVEIEMGTPLKDIIEKLGGGAMDGKEIVAVQTGGPSGGVIPLEHLETPVSYEHLNELGSIMGSGGMIVIDEDDCFVDLVKFYLGFCVEESCGKCAPCRIGGKQMLSILDKISEGNGAPEDLKKLRKISQAMQKASLCGLGQTAPNPVLSALKYFEKEYIEHIEEKRCRARKCKALVPYTIIEDKCKRCSLCFKKCPVSAISGDRQNGFIIDQDKCIRCGMCYEVCKFDSIARG